MSEYEDGDGLRERGYGRRKQDAFKHFATWSAGIAGIPVAALILYIAQALGTIQAQLDALDTKVDAHCHLERN